jgi:hypothetical protein
MILDIVVISLILDSIVFAIPFLFLRMLRLEPFPNGFSVTVCIFYMFVLSVVFKQLGAYTSNAGGLGPALLSYFFLRSNSPIINFSRAKVSNSSPKKEKTENKHEPYKRQFVKEEPLPAGTVIKPDGTPCEISNLKNGSGFVVNYNRDSSEHSRTYYKDGQFVRKEFS